MAAASARGPAPIRNHPRATVLVLSVVGYGLVVGTFLGWVPAAVFPDLTLAQVNLLADAIAAINTVTTLLLVAD
jgi:putative membrane protein